MSGKTSFLAGLSAEEQVARDYERRGYAICRRRWRGKGGEIDLIAGDGSNLVFIEVKKACDFARALERLSLRQLGRIYRSAGEYLGRMPHGLNTSARIDVALVNASGQIQIVENAFGH
jgi:putative endonuclease